MKLKTLSASVVLSLGLCFDSMAAGGYLDDARQFLQQGKVNSAVIQLKNALQEDPSNAEARLMLAESYLKLGDGASAEKEFRRAAKLHAPKARWQVGLGRALMLQQKAKVVIDEMVPDPTQSAAIQASLMNLRGEAFMLLQNLKESKSAFQQALKTDPENLSAQVGLARIAVAENDRERAKSILDQVLLKSPDDVPALLMRGELARQAGRLEPALADFDRVVALNKTNLQGRLVRIAVNLQLRRFDQVENDLQVLNTIAPNSVILEYLTAASAYQQQKLAQAEEHAQRVLAALPGHIPSQLIYGATLYQRGELALAEEYLSRVYATMPKHLPVIKMLAAARLKLKQIPRAIEVLQPAVESAPKDPQLLAMLGNAYLQSGRFQEGAELLSRAVEISPKLASLRAQLAFGLLAQGKTTGAIDELQLAVDLDQDLVQADVLLVLSHLRNKEIDKALAASKALEQRMPKNPLAYNLSGLAYLAAGDETKAKESFNRALEVDPGFVTAEKNLARIELKNRRLDAAEKHFRSVLAKAPSDLAALVGMAGIAERKNDAAGVISWLERAQSSNPRSIKPGIMLTQVYLRRGEALKALRAASETAGENPDDPIAMRNLGAAQLAAKEVNSAVRSLDQLTRLQPTAKNFLLLATAQRRAGNMAAARGSLQKALELDANSFPALVALGAMEMQEGNLEQAMRVAKSIQQHYPEKGSGYELEGTVLLREKKPQKALAAFAKAYAATPTAKVAAQLARMHLAFGERDKGVAVLADWLQKRPDDLAMRTTYAVLLQESGDEAKAIEQYEEVLKRNPDSLLALNNLAWLYQRSGNERALELARQAYEQAPERSEITDTYGWALVRFGAIDKAIPLLQEAMAKAPENPEIAYHLGHALMKVGKTEQGAKVLKRVRANYPNTPFAKQALELLTGTGAAKQ